MGKGIVRSTLLFAFVLGICLLIPEFSHAVPSYARQTNLACNSCHYVFPELTSFGRLFKLHGYTTELTGDVVEAKDKKDRTLLRLLKTPPLSAMLQATVNRLNTRLPGTQNNNINLPEQLSFFFAGQVSPKFGTFIQFTYAIQGASFSLDLIDMRYSNETSFLSNDLIYGATFNNSPTIQDVWNSTPTWIFPYASSSVTPEPIAAPLIEGGLDVAAAGLGFYSLYDNALYTEVDLYRSAQQGGPHPPDSTSTGIIKKAAPYWRAVWQHQFSSQYLSIGTYGLYSQMFPAGISGLTNKFTDIAFDLQTEREIKGGNLTAHATWINEQQKLDATFPAGSSEKDKIKLNSFKANLNYYFLDHFGASLGYFVTTGDSDSLLYAPANGSLTGKPDTDGLIAELDFLPWMNAKFSIQYAMYNKFNGAKNNYDGFGRNASDNNTILLMAWFAE